MTPPFSLSLDARGRVVLHRDGEEDLKDVRIRRVFPWSDPGHYLSLRSSEGKEVMLIDDLSHVGDQTRSLIESQLSRGSFIPRITRVEQVDTRFGYQLWTVQTDRGPAEFRVQEREDIRFLNDGRFRLKDADGNVYELPPAETLDEHSRREVEAIV